MKKLMLIPLALLLLSVITVGARLDPINNPKVTQRNYNHNYDNQNIPEEKDNNIVLYIIIGVLALSNIVLIVYIKKSKKYNIIVSDTLYPSN